jgi:hypothetical protein
MTFFENRGEESETYQSRSWLLDVRAAREGKSSDARIALATWKSTFPTRRSRLWERAAQQSSQ